MDFLDVGVRKNNQGYIGAKRGEPREERTRRNHSLQAQDPIQTRARPLFQPHLYKASTPSTATHHPLYLSCLLPLPPFLLKRPPPLQRNSTAPPQPTNLKKTFKKPSAPHPPAYLSHPHPVPASQTTHDSLEYPPCPSPRRTHPFIPPPSLHVTYRFAPPLTHRPYPPSRPALIPQTARARDSLA